MRRAQAGITLVEVLFSVVICATGIVMSAQGVSVALRVEKLAEDRERASRLGRDLLAELESGERDLADASGTFEEDDRFRWQVTLTNADVEGLRQATVAVLWNDRSLERSFEVVRLFYEDPDDTGATDE